MRLERSTARQIVAGVVIGSILAAGNVTALRGSTVFSFPAETAHAATIGCTPVSSGPQTGIVYQVAHADAISANITNDDYAHICNDPYAVYGNSYWVMVNGRADGTCSPYGLPLAQDGWRIGRNKADYKERVFVEFTYYDKSAAPNGNCFPAAIEVNQILAGSYDRYLVVLVDYDVHFYVAGNDIWDQGLDWTSDGPAVQIDAETHAQENYVSGYRVEFGNLTACGTTASTGCFPDLGAPATNVPVPDDQLYNSITNPNGLYARVNSNTFQVCDDRASNIPCEGPTLATVSSVRTTRAGGTVTLHWTVIDRAGIAGFNAFAGKTRLNQTLIPVHRARGYTYSARWSGPGPFRLAVVMARSNL